MSQLRNILVGVDGSTYSDVAIELAIQWTEQHECRLFGIDLIDEVSIAHRSYGFVDVAARLRQEDYSRNEFGTIRAGTNSRQRSQCLIP